MKEKITRWFPQAWTLEMVANAVEKGIISPDEYAEITGKEYA